MASQSALASNIDDPRASSEAVPRRGMMYVLSAPSGGGKSSIAAALMQRDPNLRLSLSMTTRPQRPGEVDGQHYIFASDDEFDAAIESGELLEYADVMGQGYRYGTPRQPVEDSLEAGVDVLFDIDWQGTRQLAEKMRLDLVTIFVLPPSMDELERRLRGRGRDPEDVIARRMAKAAEEISHWGEYQYILINRDFNETVDQAEMILRGARLKRRRQTGMGGFVKDLLDNA
ncbi:MAG: guanylate kinase [Alphaproteobacteria bacterium]